MIITRTNYPSRRAWLLWWLTGKNYPEVRYGMDFSEEMADINEVIRRKEAE